VKITIVPSEKDLVSVITILSKKHKKIAIEELSSLLHVSNPP
jgi:Mn-dependent DtxR family transcriptional regulator